MPIKTILSSITKPIFGVIDKAVVDRDLKKQIEHDIELALIDTAEFYEKQITDRHKFDMQSDSYLSKNIRPLSLAFVTLVFVVISFADGNIGQFSVNEGYIPVYMSLLMMVYGFYFGGRSLEKSVKMYKDNHS